MEQQEHGYMAILCGKCKFIRKTRDSGPIESSCKNVIQADDEFALAVYARNLWTADPAWFGLPPQPPQLQTTLVYFDVGGQRVPIATTTVDLTDTWTTYLLNAGPIPAGSGAIGKKLGIELYNPLLIIPSWIGIDNVRFVPEPTTIALLGLGGLALLRKRR